MLHILKCVLLDISKLISSNSKLFCPLKSFLSVLNMVSLLYGFPRTIPIWWSHKIAEYINFQVSGFQKRNKIYLAFFPDYFNNNKMLTFFTFSLAFTCHNFIISTFLHLQFVLQPFHHPHFLNSFIQILCNQAVIIQYSLALYSIVSETLCPICW